MHKRLYLFLEKHKVLFDLQFGFRNNHSTEHALISLTEKVREACDSGKIACGVFLDLRKAFDTVNHSILLEKLKHYGIRGVAYEWFQSFLKERMQYVSIQSDTSRTEQIDYGVPQGSVLGPLLFIIFINDFHNAIRFSTVHHYADDTNLLLCNNSLKKINKHINHDLKLLTQWLKANKISLNTDKTEIMLFKPKNKPIKKHLNFRISGQRIELTKTVKYLGILFQDDLHWDKHLTILLKKLSRAIGILSKIRHYVPLLLLRTIYYSLFNSHMIYGCQIWGQNSSILLTKIKKLQEKALKIMNFKAINKTANQNFHELKILKFQDFVNFRNFNYIRDSLNKTGPQVFHNSLTPLNQLHLHSTRGATNNSVHIPQVRTAFYGINSIKYQSAVLWNNTQNTFNIDFVTSSYPKCKKILFQHYLSCYSQ